MSPESLSRSNSRIEAVCATIDNFDEPDYIKSFLKELVWKVSEKDGWEDGNGVYEMTPELLVSSHFKSISFYVHQVASISPPFFYQRFDVWLGAIKRFLIISGETNPKLIIHLGVAFKELEKSLQEGFSDERMQYFIDQVWPQQGQDLALLTDSLCNRLKSAVIFQRIKYDELPFIFPHMKHDLVLLLSLYVEVLSYRLSVEKDEASQQDLFQRCFDSLNDLRQFASEEPSFENLFNVSRSPSHYVRVLEAQLYAADVLYHNESSKHCHAKVKQKDAVLDADEVKRRLQSLHDFPPHGSEDLVKSTNYPSVGRIMVGYRFASNFFRLGQWAEAQKLYNLAIKAYEKKEDKLDLRIGLKPVAFIMKAQVILVDLKLMGAQIQAENLKGVEIAGLYDQLDTCYDKLSALYSEVRDESYPGMEGILYAIMLCFHDAISIFDNSKMDLSQLAEEQVKSSCSIRTKFAGFMNKFIRDPNVQIAVEQQGFSVHCTEVKKFAQRIVASDVSRGREKAAEVEAQKIATEKKSADRAKQEEVSSRAEKELLDDEDRAKAKAKAKAKAEAAELQAVRDVEFKRRYEEKLKRVEREIKSRKLGMEEKPSVVVVKADLPFRRQSYQEKLKSIQKEFFSIMGAENKEGDSELITENEFFKAIPKVTQRAYDKNNIWIQFEALMLLTDIYILKAQRLFNEGKFEKGVESCAQAIHCLNGKVFGGYKRMVGTKGNAYALTQVINNSNNSYTAVQKQAVGFVDTRIGECKEQLNTGIKQVQSELNRVEGARLEDLKKVVRFGLNKGRNEEGRLQKYFKNNVPETFSEPIKELDWKPIIGRLAGILLDEEKAGGWKFPRKVLSRDDALLLWCQYRWAHNLDGEKPRSGRSSVSDKSGFGGIGKDVECVKPTIDYVAMIEKMKQLQLVLDETGKTPQTVVEGSVSGEAKKEVTADEKVVA